MNKTSKSLIAIAAAVALVLLAPSMVSAKKPSQAIGTIETWNDSAKELVLKDAAGKQWVLGWNEKTKVTGAPRVGEHAGVKFKTDKHGKAWASEIHVGADAEAMLNPPKK